MSKPATTTTMGELRRRQQIALVGLAGYTAVQFGVLFWMLAWVAGGVAPSPSTVTQSARPPLVVQPGPDELEALLTDRRREVARRQHWAWVGVALLLLVKMVALWGLWAFVFRPGLALLHRDHHRMQQTAREREADMSRQRFQRRVTGALEMVEREGDLMRLFSRASMELGPPAPLEVLLADSSEAHMRVGAEHPTAGSPGCGVENPWQCPALRRGRTSLFPDSTALDACPHLVDREQTCAAACVPLTFMGDSLGVAHVTFDREEGIDKVAIERLEFLASATAARLSTIRSFEQVQLQATTDPLTGLLNRRALEVQVRKLVEQGSRFAVAIADLDHFKRLNDTHGHDAGDRALVTFAKAMQDAVRPHDLLARFGGEEFILVFHDAGAEQAAQALERVRAHLAKVVSGADTPTFTASFGVSDTRVGTDLAMLIQVADAALLRAKDTGRDRVVIADMGEADARIEPLGDELRVA